MEKARILVVEDESIIAMELKSCLMNLGHQVTSVVNSGEKAIEKAATETPDLILMDIRIKGEMDGIDAAEVIRTRYGIPVVFSTAFLDEEKIERAKITMPFGYVLKPIQERELKVTIEMALYVAKVDKNRRQAEAQLRESEERYKIAFETDMDAVTITTMDGVYVDVNPAFSRKTQYQRGEVIGKTSRDIDVWVSRDDRARLISALQQDGYIENMETRFRCKDGSILTTIMAARIIELHGQPHIFLFTKDITEQKATVQELQASQLFFSQLFEQSSTSMCLYRPDGTIEKANPEFCAMFGVEERAIVNGGYTVFKDQAIIDAGVISHLNHLFIEKKPYQWEIRYDLDLASASTGTVTSKRGILLLEVFGYPILGPEGELQHVVLQHYDITNRIKAERALQESEQKFRRIYEHNAIGIVLAALDLKLMNANEAYCRMLGLTEEQIIGKTLRDFTHPDDIDDQMQKQDQLSRGNVDHFLMEKRYLHSDGHTVHGIINASVIRDDEGQPAYFIGSVLDITERKQAEERIKATLKEKEALLHQIQQSEERYRLLVENAVAGIGISHQERILFANQNLCRMFGLDSVEALCSKSLLEYATPTSREKIRDRMDRKAAGEEVPIEFEHDIIRKDGEIRTLLLHVTSIEYQGLPCRQSTFIDITDRKRLEESEERFRTLFQKSPYPVALTDTTSGRLIDVNEMFCQKTGTEKEAIIGKTSTELGFYSKEDRDRFTNRLLNQEKVEGLEMKFRTSKGVLDARMYARFIGVNGHNYILTMFEDITERKQIENDLKHTAWRLMEAQRVARVGDWEWLPDSNTVTWSEQLYHIMGLDPSAPPPDYEGNLALYHQEDAELLSQAVSRSLNEGIPYELELRRTTPDGKTMTLLVKGVADRNEDGKINRLYGSVQDITRLKQAEEQIKASLREKETLLQEVHHRVKNNMAIVASLLKLQIYNSDNEEVKTALLDNQNRVQAISLIHEILYQSDSLGSVNMRDYLSQLAETILQGFDTRGNVSLKVQAQEISLSVSHASPIGLIANELITNALKYAFPDKRKGELMLNLNSNDQNEVVLVIADDGIGIPENKKIWDTGSMGLKLVKSIAENQLHGSIEVTHTKGTQFTIIFAPDL